MDAEHREALRAYVLPGRLSSPQMEVKADPRISPPLLRTLGEVGLDRNREPRSLSTLPPRLSTVDLAVLMAEVEAGFESMYEALPNDLLSDDVELETEKIERLISGGDDQDMTLHVYRPRLREGPLPCIMYFHGGGMVFLQTLNKVHERWCRSLAAAGLVVVLVDFRNAYTAASYRPFPAGLNDCASAVHYVHSNRDALDIRSIILQGEGGGGNLALATALKANREGWTHKIAGVYAIAPYISCAYNWPLARKARYLPSLVECNGYYLNVSVLAYTSRFYTPHERDRTNPLAWPYHATEEDLQGLPPHALMMDELDPLRDEGIAYARKLSHAGVNVVGKTNLGVVHKTSVVFRKAVPQLHKSIVGDIVAFAKRV